MTRADLTGANLRNADLEGAILIETNLEDADLSSVRNWSTRQFEVAKLRNTKLPEGCTISQPEGEDLSEP